MAPDFIRLADLLREVPPPPLLAAASQGEAVPAVRDESACAASDLRDALRAARLFRARLADALDEARATLLRGIAIAVVGRELALAPCVLDRIVADAASRAPVVRVRVAPCDTTGIDLALPVVGDASLAPGDVVIELEGGAIDARLGVRLLQVLEAFA